jgi:hypothetical protein
VAQTPEEREYQRAYHQKNKERRNAAQRAYNEKNRERLRAMKRAHYHKTKHLITEAQKDQNRRQHFARRAPRKALLVGAKSVPCMDCGGSFPHYVMDLDHVRGVKRACVSRMVTAEQYSLADIIAEIAKCDPVCANCHRERTHKHGGVPKSRKGPVLLRDAPGLFENTGSL